jgi:ribokinase
VRVRAVRRAGKPTRRAFVYLDADGERTITTVGERLQPVRRDDLPWEELERADGVYFVAGDVDGLASARCARALVATARIGDLLERAHVRLDAVVGSARDAAERQPALDPPPALVVTTAGAEGGSWSAGEGRSGRWAAAALPGPRRDAYGAGDSFAAGLTYALADGREVDAALTLAARCGAFCMTGRGPYERQLTAAQQS